MVTLLPAKRSCVPSPAAMPMKRLPSALKMLTLPFPASTASSKPSTRFAPTGTPVAPSAGTSVSSCGALVSVPGESSAIVRTASANSKRSTPMTRSLPLAPPLTMTTPTPTVTV